MLKSLILLIVLFLSIKQNHVLGETINNISSNKEAGNEKKLEHHRKTHIKKPNCSIFNYIISILLKKTPKCKQEDLKIPSEKEILNVLKVIDDLTTEKKIDFTDSLSKEVVYVDKAHAKEATKRLGETLRNIGSGVDHLIIKLMVTLVPLLIRLNKGKFDLTPLIKLIRNHAKTLEEQYAVKSNNTVKKLVWKKKLDYKIERRGMELIKKNAGMCPTKQFNIKENGFGPLVKENKQKLINIVLSIMPPQGFIKLGSFKDYYNKKVNAVKDKSSEIYIQVHKSMARDKKMDDKMCVINSLIKAIQINNETVLEEQCTNILMSDYVDVGPEIPNMKGRVKRILRIDKKYKELNIEEKNRLNNLSAISKIILSNCEFIQKIGLLPLDIIKEYSDILHLKLFHFKNRENALNALKRIVNGNNDANKAIVCTALIFWGNVYDSCNMHYLNVIHSYDDGTFLIEDTDGTRYKPSQKYKKSLIDLMKICIKKPLRTFIKNFESILTSGLGEDIKNKLLDEIEIFIQERMGGKNVHYCFIVSDPKNILGNTNTA